MRRLACLLALLASAALAQSTPMTPLRVAVIHEATAPSVTPGDCTFGTSPNVIANDDGSVWTCINSGASDYYEAIPIITYSTLPNYGLLDITGTDPVLEFAPITSSGGGGMRWFSCAAGCSSALFAMTQGSNGTVTAAASGGSVGGNWNFTGTVAPIVTVTGGIQATTFNKVAVTAPASGSTLAIADGKTFTVNETLALTGTTGTTHTFPATTSSVARIDAAQTFAGVQTFSAQDVHTLGVDLSTSGRLNSQVADAAAAVSFLVKPSVALTSSFPPDRYVYQLQDSAGTFLWSIAADGSIGSQVTAHTGAALMEIGSSAITLPSSNMSIGIKFAPKWAATAGATYAGIANTALAGYFSPTDNASATATTLLGGYFTNGAPGARAHSNIIGGAFKAFETTMPSGTQAHGNIYGVIVKTPASATSTGNTASNSYGVYVESASANKPTGQTDTVGVYVAEQTSTGATNKYGIFLANATAGYKAIAIRDTNTWIGSSAAATLDFTATTTQATGNFKLTTAGNGHYIKEGTNATMGIATLVAGVAVVSTTKVTANSRIFLTRQTVAGTVGTSVDVTARTAGTSFTITAAGSVLDTSTVAWLIIEPG